jgi:glycosyltransferase involved in cell wall biosynthesis
VAPSSDPSGKPEIIVVALSIDSSRGSEPGKGWWWSSALSEHFRLHIITQKHSVEITESQPLARRDGWTFHPTQRVVDTWKLPKGYLLYNAWLKEALAISRDLIARHPIRGLCHVTLGSFRFLPRYDRRGGESSPLAMTWNRPAPLAHKIVETLRPLMNNSFAVLPHLRTCLRSARLVLNTSQETEHVAKIMGARRTQVVFPDAYDAAVDVEKICSRRASQIKTVAKKIRLLWQGRPFWWKGPDLAFLILRAALDAGLKAELTMVSNWDSAFGGEVRALAEKLDVAPHLRFVGNMSREQFLEMSAQHHAMLATSLHDSGGIPLIEAQALGLPCITLGLGGHKLSACPEAGVSESPHDIGPFVQRSVACLTRWQQSPEVWLKESRSAVIFSTQFTIKRLARDVGEFIVPAFRKV